MTCPHCAARSTPQHRRYFKLIEAAFMHWPDEDITSKEQLRAWLQCKAGYHKITEIEGDMTPQMMHIFKLVLSASKNYGWIKEHRGKWYCFTPKSIAFDQMKKSEFNDLNAKVEQIICDTIGVRDGDELLREYGKAA